MRIPYEGHRSHRTAWALAAVCSAILLLAAARGAPAAETIRLRGGGSLQGDVLKETEEQIFVDLGFTILAVPKSRIAERQAPREGAAPDGREAGPATQGDDEPDEADGGAQEVRGVYFVREGARAPIKSHAETFGDAVVRITTPQGLGSGFVVHAEEGLIVTNQHVIEREQKITVTFFLRKGRQYEKVTREQVRIVALNAFVDLALLKVEDVGELNIPQVFLTALEDDLKVGDPVFAIGNPLGFERSVSEGIVSKTDREVDGLLYIQTTAPINPGNSGGPLFNDRGEVVGITNMKTIFTEGLGFAIPVGVLKDFLRHRSAFAYDKENPNTGYRYLPPPRKPVPPSRSKSSPSEAPSRSGEKQRDL